MSMAATANSGLTGRDEGSSPLILSPRALRLPVAVSLFLHASVFAGLLFWWQSTGTPAPRGLPEGIAVTFVSLSEPAPAAPVSMPVEAAKPVAVPQPELKPEPKPAPVVEPVPEPAPVPDPVVALPEPVARPQPAETQPVPDTSASQSFQTASLAPPDARDGTGEGASLGFEQTDGEQTEEVIISEPRYRSTPLPYPRRARDLGQEGTARVRVKIDPRGLPAEVMLLESSGYALLDHAAVKAVGRWTFEPHLHGGRPVSGWADVPVRYVLN